MNLEDIKKFFEENKENEDVQEFLQGLVSLETVKAFADKDKDAKSWLDSVKDQHLNKGLETWKTNNLESLLDAEIKKRFPEKDDKDIELEQIKAKLAQMETEKMREQLTNKAIKIANEKKLPLDLVDLCIGADEQTTVDNLAKLEGVFSKHLQTEVEARLKGGSYTPPDGKPQTSFTLEQIKNMTPAEYSKNKAEIDKLIASGNLK